MPSGGKRAGAGRPRKATTHARPIAKAEKRCADRLPGTIANLERIADGSAPEVEETWEAAGLAVVQVALTDEDGEVVEDAKGRPKLVKRLAFPGLPPEQLVLVRRKVTTAGPDRQANEYLADRVMGRPRQALEHSGEGGGPLKILVEYEDALAHPEAPEAAPRPGEDPPGDAAV